VCVCEFVCVFVIVLKCERARAFRILERECVNMCVCVCVFMCVFLGIFLCAFPCVFKCKRTRARVASLPLCECVCVSVCL